MRESILFKTLNVYYSISHAHPPSFVDPLSVKILFIAQLTVSRITNVCKRHPAPSLSFSGQSPRKSLITTAPSEYNLADGGQEAPCQDAL